ncbi:MAG: response regulator [Thermoplasmatales archaeon]|nr:response regulator [Thermoplasmatales archaeon]
MKKIMLVDDEEDQVFGIKTALEYTGGDEYEVIPARNGAECFELLKNNETPDLILLDIMMPGMSGWEVFDKLRDNPSWKDIPIVFLTARTDRIAENAGSFLGDDFIEKPVDAEELKNRIDKVLKKEQ